MAVSFTKFQNEITKAWRDVADSKETQKWALFGYEGNTNNIKLMSIGSNGLRELVKQFDCSLIQYAFCRVLDRERSLNKLILINWQGDSSPLSRKGLCASHLSDVISYFKGSTQTITIRNDDEATQEHLMEQIARTSSSSRISLPSDYNNSMPDTINSEGSSSTYKKTDINSVILNDRQSFWQRQEEEEKARLLEEKKRAAEKQVQFESERKLKEESEVKRLAEAIKERDRVIEATRQAGGRESSGSQPSSILSSNASQSDVKDERVGRRSELIQLERNQETNSLISKGLIKNKRAVFEQVSQQQSGKQKVGDNIPRRASGAIVSQRLNTFESLDHGGGCNSGDVEKLANGLAKNVSIASNESKSTITTVRKEIEPITIDNSAIPTVTPVAVDLSGVGPKEILNGTECTVSTTGDSNTSNKQDSNEKFQYTPYVSSNQGEVSEVPIDGITKTPVDESSELSKDSNSHVLPDGSVMTDVNARVFTDGKGKIKARAVWDYQAADDSEISFDPEDIIGRIDKVDVNWWYGVVMTGKYQGQDGYFPSNFVEELSNDA